MKKLHPKQVEILDLLKQNIDSPLTIRELGYEIGVESPSVIHHHLTALEKKGYLKRNPHNPKDYQILDLPDKLIVYINKYGMAQCGPNGTILDGNPIERIPIASSLLKFPASEAFIVEAKGDSMDPKIKNGDIIIAKKQSRIVNGDIIVCVYKSEALIKQFSKKDDRISLVSFNPDIKKYPPLVVKEEEELKIEGVVRNILNYNQ